jgi:hypothetical protein
LLLCYCFQVQFILRLIQRSEYQQVELAIENDLSAKVFNLLTAIPQNYELNDKQQLEHNNFVNYANFRASILSEGLIYKQLNETILVNLRAIANAGELRSASLAETFYLLVMKNVRQELLHKVALNEKNSMTLKERTAIWSWSGRLP